jgi:hypothetical protein
MSTPNIPPIKDSSHGISDTTFCYDPGTQPSRDIDIANELEVSHHSDSHALAGNHLVFMGKHWSRWPRFGSPSSQLAGVLRVIQVVRLPTQEGQLLAGLNVLEEGAIWTGRRFIPGRDNIKQPEMASTKKTWIFAIGRGVEHSFPEETFRHGSTGEGWGK